MIYQIQITEIIFSLPKYMLRKKEDPANDMFSEMLSLHAQSLKDLSMKNTFQSMYLLIIFAAIFFYSIYWFDIYCGIFQIQTYLNFIPLNIPRSGLKSKMTQIATRTMIYVTIRNLSLDNWAWNPTNCCEAAGFSWLMSDLELKVLRCQLDSLQVIGDMNHL